ncbi:MAG TPA: two-component regulator propeller domain-containing protein, partial [Marinilabiliaceae bacterium]|nr:two-component regulator propeller domain-containing protein [Marinilabiliaceae bacterium]
MKIFNLIFILFFSFVCDCYSQVEQTHKSIFDRNLQFHLIDDAAGLSNNFINDILQDSLGYIWVSTFDGLNRYDGTEFKKFKDHFDSEN